MLKRVILAYVEATEYEAVMKQISQVRMRAGEETSQIRREIQTAESNAEVARLQAQIDNIAERTEEQVSRLALKSALPIPEPPPVRRFDGNRQHTVHAKNSPEWSIGPGPQKGFSVSHAVSRLTCMSCQAQNHQQNCPSSS